MLSSLSKRAVTLLLFCKAADTKPLGVTSFISPVQQITGQTNGSSALSNVLVQHDQRQSAAHVLDTFRADVAESLAVWQYL